MAFNYITNSKLNRVTLLTSEAERMLVFFLTLSFFQILLKIDAEEEIKRDPNIFLFFPLCSATGGEKFPAESSD